MARNLDYYINTNATAIKKMNAGEGRYASIGVIGCCEEFTSELAADGRWDEIYRYLPLRTQDGINEKGVYCAINLVPAGESSIDRDKWQYGEWGLGARFTNPGAEHTYCTRDMNRFILDNASSVENAIGKIRSVNWYDPVLDDEDYPTQSYQWIIADKDRNCVLEFVENTPVFLETEDLRSPSLRTIITNFSNVCMEKDVWQDHGEGYERFNVLRNPYNDTEESFDGMESLMHKVWYSQYYTLPHTYPEFWSSEAALGLYPTWEVYSNPDIWDDPDFVESVLFEKSLWDDKSNWFTDDTWLWFTVHNSIYNISEKRMEVIVHEGMFDMKDYRSFGLDCSFNKPLDLCK